MKPSFVAAGLALALGAGFSLSSFAQAPSPADNMVRQRQAAMVLQGKYFGPLGAMAQGKAPYNAATVSRNAGFLDALVKMPWDGFTPETANTTLKTRAMPEIYKDPSGFRNAADQLQTAVGKLAAEAKGGNEASVKAAIGDVGKACGNCHDKFRTKQ